MAATKAEGRSLVSDLHRLLESSEGADVTLVVGDSELPAHSLILAARSPVFAAMLRNDMREARSRRIEISDTRDAVLRLVLVFMYTDRCPQLGDMAAEVLAAADKYDLPLLKGRCERQLVRDLSVENAAARAVVAVMHHCPGLRDAVMQFIAGHPEVMATSGWERVLREDAASAVEVCQWLAGTLSAQPRQAPGTWILTEESKQLLGRQLVNAAYEGQTGEMRALLEVGAPVNVSDDAGDSALHASVESGCEEAVRCLLDAGADVNARDPQGRTPLHFAAAMSGEQHAVWMLLAAGAGVDAQDADGRTPLFLAALFGCAFSAKALLMAGARRDLRDHNGNSPEDVATVRTRPLFNSE